MLLRYALLTAVEEGTLEVAAAAGATFFDVIERDPLIANIGQSQHVLRRDYLTVDAAQLGLSPVADAALELGARDRRTLSRRGVWAARLAVVTDANDSIAALARVPTARLERLLGRAHRPLLLPGRRLDHGALLAAPRADARGTAGSAGLYIGAYGWVENLHPDWSERTPVAGTRSRRRCATAARGRCSRAPTTAASCTRRRFRRRARRQCCATPICRMRRRGSATCSASTSRRRACAWRRRTSRASATASRSPRCSATSSSADCTSAIPGVELDAYRYVLRDRFPFLAGKLTEMQVGVNAEVVEARNVVNGLDLLEHTADRRIRTDSPGCRRQAAPEAKAIIAEIDRLRDGLDAVSDLLLAESVHQAVHGNMERTKASLQALTDPEAAPDPEVMRTPRSARLLTFRMTLALDAAATAQVAGLADAARRGQPGGERVARAASAGSVGDPVVGEKRRRRRRSSSRSRASSCSRSIWCC